ncbi:multiple sugar transport system substrate-binding protein [Psychromicrobium silvestre]|uniref:Multiple sugar transport system substrate-binding protein n=1 Tax=Psychromicrobium silvestre TaxID=1645614 RepID=A0A7Y9LVB4_9MICC|nr:extracellular solute-binding protein [Psychromicrobium silvestre]NYE96282.1 multiple sugar transport system substrate-binding protein [Psychromicrobium silvestre]
MTMEILLNIASGSIDKRTLRRRTFLGVVAASSFLLPALSGCTSSPANTLRIAYQQWGSGKVMENFLSSISGQFRAKHPDLQIQLIPLVAAENDYFTKNELMMSSDSTTPDLVCEDTFILKSDVAAGYLQPLNQRLEGWQPWNEVFDSAKTAVTGEDGKVYGMPTGTDTRALWYNSELLAKAGLPMPWQPKDWTQLLKDLRSLHKALPEVIPFNIFSGKAQGEKASMQGFEMLMYGTGDTLYDGDRKKWLTGSQGFIDSLDFVQKIYQEKLGPPLSRALDANLTETVYSDWLPKGGLAVALDGGWISNNWVPGAPAEWPEWSKVMKQAKMPTQKAQAPGYTTLSGGWCWAIPARTKKADLAWEYLQTIATTANMTAFNIADNGVAVRKDVAAQPKYRSYTPTIQFFTSLVEGATFRPALAAYPQISASIQLAMEKVMIGGSTPKQAAQDYDEQITKIVGADQVMGASGR